MAASLDTHKHRTKDGMNTNTKVSEDPSAVVHDDFGYSGCEAEHIDIMHPPCLSRNLAQQALLLKLHGFHIETSVEFRTASPAHRR